MGGARLMGVALFSRVFDFIGAEISGWRGRTLALTAALLGFREQRAIHRLCIVYNRSRCMMGIPIQSSSPMAL